MPVVFRRAGGDPKVACQKMTKLTNTLHAYSIQKSVLHGHWLRISCQCFTLGQITTRGQKTKGVSFPHHLIFALGLLALVTNFPLWMFVLWRKFPKQKFTKHLFFTLYSLHPSHFRFQSWAFFCKQAGMCISKSIQFDQYLALANQSVVLVERLLSCPLRLAEILRFS